MNALTSIAFKRQQKALSFYWGFFVSAIQALTCFIQSGFNRHAHFPMCFDYPIFHQVAWSSAIKLMNNQSLNALYSHFSASEDLSIFIRY